MSYDVREQWSSKTTTKEIDSWGASRYFSVTATTIAEMQDERAVLLANDLPKTGESHPSNRDLRCFSLEAGPGLTERIVTARYQWLPGFTGTNSTDPLQQKPTLNITRTTRSEQLGWDIYGNPYVNAAGDPFEVLVERSSRVLTFTRYERGWNDQLTDKLEDCVSSREMIIGGRKFPPETVLLLVVNPVGDFAIDAPVIPIAYSLEIRGIGSDSVAGISTQEGNLTADAKFMLAHPFVEWRANFGRRGLLAKDTPCDLYYKSTATGKPKNQCTEDVPLTKAGLPMSSRLIMSDDGLTVAESTGAPSPAKPTYIKQPVSGGPFWFGYEKHRRANLLQLQL